jgi:hypothetical protein
MLTRTYFTDFNIRAFKGLWKSLRGITKHYTSVLRWFTKSKKGYMKVCDNDGVYDEAKRKPQERQPREANLFIFLTLILNL